MSTWEYNPTTDELDRTIDKDILNLVNGTTKEKFDALITSNGTTVTLTLTEESSSGTLTFNFSDGPFALSTPATIELTTGSDTSPTTNYIYVLQSTKALTKPHLKRS